MMLSHCSKHCVYIVDAPSRILFSLVVRGLWFSVWAFSSFGERGLHSSLQCRGFSLQGLLLLRSMGSRHTGSVVVARRLSCSSCSSCSSACGITGTRYQTHVLYTGRQIFNHWTTREVPSHIPFYFSFKDLKCIGLR